MPLGTVEQVVTDSATGRPSALIVRHGRADYLLRIPARLVAEARRDYVRLSISFEDVETAAAVSDEGAATPDDVLDVASTEKSPLDENVLGRPPGEPPRSPATG
jgi:hypothetical protein